MQDTKRSGSINTARVEEHPPFGPARSPEQIERSHREWFALRDLTDYASVSERTLRSWIYSSVDPLPAVKISGKVLIRRSDFDAYLQRHRVKPLEQFNIDAIVRDLRKGAPSGR